MNYFRLKRELTLFIFSIGRFSLTVREHSHGFLEDIGVFLHNVQLVF
nr:MAG TPA: hypothetical protein [Caudoviricetes sp.]